MGLFVCFFTGCVTLGKLLCHVGFPFPHLCKDNENDLKSSCGVKWYNTEGTLFLMRES